MQKYLALVLSLVLLSPLAWAADHFQQMDFTVDGVARTLPLTRPMAAT